MVISARRTTGRRRTRRLRRSVIPVAAAGLVLAAVAAPAQAVNEHAKGHAVCSAVTAGNGRCHVHIAIDNQGKPVTSANALPNGWYGPTEFSTAYGLPTGKPTGTPSPTIGIVDAYDDPNIKNDLASYSTAAGLPQMDCKTGHPCFTKLNQRGSTSGLPKTDPGWALEIALDVEAAHAACRYCNILLVEATNNSTMNLLTAEDYAVTHADVVSNSWGGPEFPGETAYDYHFNHSGVPITVSSGDNGFGVEWPAASPYVTAVGGTTLDLDTTTLNRVSETAWSGTGSGCSAYEAKPDWQQQLSDCSRRMVADVAADADPNTGAAVYDTVPYPLNGHYYSGWFRVGGTSLSAPLIAAIYALAANAKTTSYGSYPYAHAADVPSTLNDITSGSNGSCGGTFLCTATTGYDGPTGLGTPNGVGAF
jgi:subtilase family serine protease